MAFSFIDDMVAITEQNLKTKRKNKILLSLSGHSDGIFHLASGPGNVKCVCYPKC